MKATGVVGSILVILALVIAFLKQIIAFVGFLTFAIKILVVIVFVALLIGVGFLVLRAFNDRRKAKE
jgi:multisubunit Na+/H+ antiporter MnhG subunit